MLELSPAVLCTLSVYIQGLKGFEGFWGTAELNCNSTRSVDVGIVIYIHTHTRLTALCPGLPG